MLNARRGYALFPCLGLETATARQEYWVYLPAHCNQAGAAMYVSIPNRVLGCFGLREFGWLEI